MEYGRPEERASFVQTGWACAGDSGVVEVGGCFDNFLQAEN